MRAAANGKALRLHEVEDEAEQKMLTSLFRNCIVSRHMQKLAAANCTVPSGCTGECVQRINATISCVRHWGTGGNKTESCMIDTMGMNPPWKSGMAAISAHVAFMCIGSHVDGLENGPLDQWMNHPYVCIRDSLLAIQSDSAREQLASVFARMFDERCDSNTTCTKQFHSDLTAALKTPDVSPIIPVSRRVFQKQPAVPARAERSLLPHLQLEHALKAQPIVRRFHVAVLRVIPKRLIKLLAEPVIHVSRHQVVAVAARGHALKAELTVRSSRVAVIPVI